MGTLNCRQAANSLVRLWNGKTDGDSLLSLGCSPSKFGWNQAKIVLSPVCCSKLWITAGVRLVIRHDEFHGPRSSTVRREALETTTTAMCKEIYFLSMFKA
ncbi:hypothetical protein TNCV_4323191 [Trichonephila clavipes]|nr:hypothetical protein TNCV_4323191 [Trichonephila clavipes]